MKSLKIFLIATFWFITMKKEELAIAIRYLRRNKKNEEYVRNMLNNGLYEHIHFVWVKLYNLGRDRSGKMIVAMAMPSVTQVITAILKEPRSYTRKDEFALGIINACSANPLIVILPMAITTYLLHLTAFRTAQANMALRTRGLKAIRDDAWIVVQHDLKTIMAVAQAASDANTLMGIQIIQSGNFSVKMVNGPRTNVFRFEYTGTSGTIILIAPGAPRGSLHIFEQSVDGINWKPIDKIRLTHLTVSGLTPQTKIWFRHILDTAVLPNWEIIYVSII